MKKLARVAAVLTLMGVAIRRAHERTIRRDAVVRHMSAVRPEGARIS